MTSIETFQTVSLRASRKLRPAALFASLHPTSNCPSLYVALSLLAVEHGMASLVAPVRPTLKSLYPLTTIERYARWKRNDGSPFDPWLRVHWRLGAEQLRIAPNAATIIGTVSQWEEWTGMRLPESGAYIVPRRAITRADRPGAEHRTLRRSQHLDAAPDSLLATDLSFPPQVERGLCRLARPGVDLLDVGDDRSVERRNVRPVDLDHVA